MTESVFLVKSHSWDYDFHDEVVRIFRTENAAKDYVDQHAQTTRYGGYNREKEEGLVVEEWQFDNPDSKIIYPKELIKPTEGENA